MRFEEGIWKRIPASLLTFSRIISPPPLPPLSGKTFMGLELHFYYELKQMLVSVTVSTSASLSPSPSFSVSKSVSTSLSLSISLSASGEYSAVLAFFQSSLLHFKQCASLSISVHDPKYVSLKDGHSFSRRLIKSAVEPSELSHARFMSP